MSQPGLPPSELLDETSHKALQQQAAAMAIYSEELTKFSEETGIPLTLDGLSPDALPAARKNLVDVFQRTTKYLDLKRRYPVKVKATSLGGVNAELLTASSGIETAKADKVLLNLHAGGFQYGYQTDAHEESFPIAELSGIRVACVDYRCAPEHRFPAASEDVAAVYEALLVDHEPANIGIFGYEAGALLALQSLAWFDKVGMPMPGAVSLAFGGGTPAAGDAPRYFEATHGHRTPTPSYLEGINPGDPLAFPTHSAELLSRFPPMLMLSSSRDPALSSVINTHRQLRRAGVDADLHIWEGQYVSFLYHPPIPEAQEAYALIVDFFERNLGGI